MERVQRAELRIRRNGEQNAANCAYQNDEAENLPWMASVSGALLVQEIIYFAEKLARTAGSQISCPPKPLWRA